MSTLHVVRTGMYALAALLTIAVSFITFTAFEPLALTAQESVDITVTQTITGETSFSTDPTNVTMDNTIASITGGTSNGTTSFTVQSNASSGYNVTLAFADTPSMQQDGGSGNIPDYDEDTPGTPDYGFTSLGSGNAAQFGFSVVGPEAADVATNYQDDGASSCGGGGSNSHGQCWSAGSTTALTILNSADPTTGGGDDGSVLFQIDVPANPSPAVPAGDYTATATLTVQEN